VTERSNVSSDLETLMKIAKFSLTKYISMSDIDRAGLDWDSLTEYEKKEQMWNYGMDTHSVVYEYLEYTDTHRTIQGKSYTGKRFICQERTDKGWIMGPYASKEAYLVYKKDPGLTKEINALSNSYLSSDAANVENILLLDIS